MKLHRHLPWQALASRLTLLVTIMFVAATVNLAPAIAQGAQADRAKQDAKFQLEIDKLKQDIELGKKKTDLEIKKLQKDVEEWRWWVLATLPALLGLIGGFVGAIGAYYLAYKARKQKLEDDHNQRVQKLEDDHKVEEVRRVAAFAERLGDLDQVTHEARLRCYPKLTATMAPLALYFPPAGAAKLDPRQCRAIGRAMSDWYFGEGGVILSKDARDAYFLLARALTRAAKEKTLDAPSFPRDGELISRELISDYCRMLKLDLTPDGVDFWKFSAASKSRKPKLKQHERFRDFVFLQQLSSDLRTQLATDLGSRRRPS